MGNTNTTDIEYDYLTELANRRGLYGYFDTLENDCIVHAMFLDIDNFKRVNDIYGHSMGDKLLIAISHLIQDLPIGLLRVSAETNMSPSWMEIWVPAR